MAWLESWIAGWSYRLQLIVSGSNIIETTTDFPLMIYLDSTCSGVFSELGDNSKKISLRLADYTECFVEVETWDSNSQKAVLWAKIPTMIADNNLDMYLYFDNSHEDNIKYVGLVTDTAAKNVWESAYRCVWHFAQTPAGAGSVLDSTSNINHGTPGAGVALTDGNYGKAYDFTPDTTGYVSKADNSSLDFTNTLTMHVLVYFDNLVAGTSVIGKVAAGQYSYGIEFTTSNIIRPWADENGSWGPLWIAVDTDALTTGSWLLITGVFNGSTMTLYRNGLYKAISSSSSNTIFNSNASFGVGYNSEWSQRLDGKVAFVSLAAATRSANRVLMDYKTLTNQLITIGSTEEAPTPPLPYKLLNMSILNTNIDSNLTNFPVLVHLSSSCGTNSFNASDVFSTLGSNDNRKKIAFTTVSGSLDIGNQLLVEIERWDTAISEAWLWVKVPAVASGSETKLYMYYGTEMYDNPNVGDINSPAARNVWDNGYVVVYHTSQDPSGGSECVKNSAYGLYHGTPVGSMLSEDLIDAEIDKGYDLDGADDGVSIPINASLKGLGTATMEAWVKPYGAPTTGYGGIVWESTNTLGYTRFGAFHLADKKISVIYRDTEAGSAYAATSPSALTDNVWTYVAYSVDAGTDQLVLYFNSSSVSTNSDTKGIMTNTDTLAIYVGRDNLATPECFKGVVDEARISNVCRSAAWLKASYYSGMDNLIQFGPLEDYTMRYYFSGVVREQGSPVERAVRAYRRDTGELMDTAVSISGTGAFYLDTTYSGNHYVIAIDDELNNVYNALIYDNVVPITIS